MIQLALAVFQLIAYASTADGYSADLPLPLPIRVEDENDNHPIFTEKIYNFEIPESSKLGKTTILFIALLCACFLWPFVIFLLGHICSCLLFLFSLGFIFFLTVVFLNLPKLVFTH